MQSVKEQPGDHHASSHLPHASFRALRDVSVGRCSHHGNAIQGRVDLLRAHLLSEGRRPCRRHHDAHRSQRPIGDVQFARRGQHDHLHQFHHGFGLRRCRRPRLHEFECRFASPFTTARRDNLEVSSQTVSLKGNPTELTPRFSSTNSVATLGNAHLNTTGQFVALSDQGYTSPTKKFADTTAASNTPWGYTGVAVPVNSSEVHIIRYSSQYISNAPTSIMRIDASTGAYLGTASYNTGTCGTSAIDSIHDADVYNGNVYTAHYSYYMVNKWDVGWNAAGTQVQWECKSSYNYQYPNYITGVDFDDNTGKMYISVYDTSVRNHYLKEVNPSSPTVVTGTWLMTSTSYYYDHGAGLAVSMPNVMYNIYYMNTDYKSTHFHYTMASGLLSSQGERVMPGGGHYGYG